MAVLETSRLVLRQMDAGDAAFIVELLNDADFIRCIGDKKVRTQDDAIRYVATGPGAMYARFGHGLWLVTLKASGEALGICGLLKRDAFEHADLGFAFLPAFRGCGYAREAAVGTLAYAVDVLALRRVIAIAQPGNDRSIRLLDSLGFAPEGLVRLTADGEELLQMGLSLALLCQIHSA